MRQSFRTMGTLLQEIVAIYPTLSPPNLTAHASNRVCNALALLQCVASHPETRGLFLAAHVPLYLYPFLNTVSKNRPFEYLRLTSLGVVGALVKISVEIKMFRIRSTWSNSNGFGERDRPDLEISSRDDHRSKNEPKRPHFERARRVSRLLGPTRTSGCFPHRCYSRKNADAVKAAGGEAHVRAIRAAQRDADARKPGRDADAAINRAELGRCADHGPLDVILHVGDVEQEAVQVPLEVRLPGGAVHRIANCCTTSFH